MRSNWRFIPARAGNSKQLVSLVVILSVHPRTCGELSSSRRAPSVAIGSSPRVRGTPIMLLNVIHGLRFIPARAGNSLPSYWGSSSEPVHPRACGELLIVSSKGPPSIGSSPRVRGTLDSFLEGTAEHRFIPARAGNSKESDGIAGSDSVHPRACGELKIS